MKICSRLQCPRALAASSDLALPEGSCTELPRGPSLCSARGSSVQDASGWETAGSKQASQPSLCPMHNTNWVTALPELSGPNSRAEQQAVTGFLPSAKSRAREASWASRSAESMLLNISQHLDNMRIGRADRRVKLALTFSSFKEVTVLTPALPGGSCLSAGL